MGYVVYGAGAIGAVVGGRLAQAGAQVTLIARGDHLEALRSGSLLIESPAGAETVPVPAVGHPDAIDWAASPTVLVAVKSHQTAAALSTLAAVAPPDTVVACFQNGVANESAALRLFPRVQGVCVMLPASHLEPGVVQAWSAPVTGLFDIGRYPEGSDDVSRTLAADLGEATFDTRVVDDIQRWKYRKLLKNLANVVEALCGPGERRGPLVEQVVAEGEAALAAAGRPVATEEEDRRRRGDLLHLGPIGGQAKAGDSSWQSLRRGTGQIETDYLNGEIVLLGRLHGVPTPANTYLQRRAREAALGHQQPGSVPATAILEAVAAERQALGLPATLP